MCLAHSILPSLMSFGSDRTTKFFISVGLLEWLADPTFAAEAIGGVLLVLSSQTRRVAIPTRPHSSEPSFGSVAPMAGHSLRQTAARRIPRSSPSPVPPSSIPVMAPMRRPVWRKSQA